MTETVTFHNVDFTFERVESINELPQDYAFLQTDKHETALIFWRQDFSTHVTYYDQESTGGRIYAFTKGE